MSPVDPGAFRGILEWLERQPRLSQAFIGLLLLAPLAIFDVWSGPEVALAVFYIAPVLLMAWCGGRWPAFVVAAASGLCWFVDAYVVLPSGSSVAGVAWAIVFKVAFFLTLAELTVRLRGALDRQHELARTDALTGLANVRAFVAACEYDLARARRSGRAFTAVFLDCDDFKSINDRFGHRAGDEVLRRIGAAVRASLRESDVGARMGGDEFAILLPETDEWSGRAAAEHLRADLSRAMAEGGPPVTFSVGVATFHTPPPGVNELLARIDALQYEAKRQGKDRVVGDLPRPASA